MPTFGNTTVQSTANNHGSDGKDAIGPFALTEDGVVSKISAYVKGNNVVGGQTRRGLIYSDSAGQPNALMGVTAEITVAQNQADGWVDMVFASGVPLSADDYWLGFIFGAANLGSGTFCDVAALGTYKFNVDTYPDPSDPFGTPNDASLIASIYATYDVPGAEIAWIVA